MIDDLNILLQEIKKDIDETILTLRITSLYPTTRSEAEKRLKVLQKHYVGMKFLRDKLVDAVNEFVYLS